MATPSGDMNKAGAPTLHHLNNSQSQRILWLLEELDAPYTLVLHKRDKGHRAPPEMKDVQKLGKSPILVTAEGRPITESSVIATYLLKIYDTAGRFTSADWIRDETLVSFAAATMGPLTAIELLFDIAAKHTPWPFVYLSRAMRRGVQKNFTTGEFASNLSYLEEELGENDYFNGAELGKADFMLSWPMDMIRQREWVNLAKDYPRIAAWRCRIEERAAWRRALEKGNGYDLTSW